MTDLLSTADAAAIMGVTDARVRELCIAGRLAGAVKVGDWRRGVWVVPRSSVLAWLDAPRRWRKRRDHADVNDA